MLKNYHLAQAIADVGMYEFKRQLLYKGEWYGCQVLLADRFYPSTKRCSACGEIREIALKERKYHSVCGLTIDRDLNTSINLEQLFVNQTMASSAGSNACGEHVRWRLSATMLIEVGTEHQSVWIDLSRFRGAVLYFEVYRVSRHVQDAFSSICPWSH